MAVLRRSLLLALDDLLAVTREFKWPRRVVSYGAGAQRLVIEAAVDNCSAQALPESVGLDCNRGIFPCTPPFA